MTSNLLSESLVDGYGYGYGYMDMVGKKYFLSGRPLTAVGHIYTNDLPPLSESLVVRIWIWIDLGLP